MFASFIAKSVPKNIYNNINIIKNTASNAKFDMEQRGTMRKAISQKKNDLLGRLTQADDEESVSSENALPNVKFRAPGRRNGSLKENSRMKNTSPQRSRMPFPDEAERT